MNDPNATQAMIADPMKTAMGAPMPTAGATQVIAPVQCPVCKQHNPPGDVYCVECGLLLTEGVTEEALAAPQQELPCLRDSAGREYHLRPGSNIVGRDAADVLIVDSRVSRRHADLILGETENTLEDLGSTNGTMVGTQRLQAGEKATVASGAKVFFGGFELTLSVPGDAMRTAAMPAPPVSAELVETKPDRLVVAHLVGDDGTSLSIYDGETTVGRRPTNDVVLGDPYISGSHAKFSWREGALFLTDLGSTNGTAHAGQKLEPNGDVKVGDGDEIQFGERKFTLRMAGDE